MAEAQPPPPPFVLHSCRTLSHVLSEKLTETNYLLWKQQVEPVIKGHRLHSYLVAPQIPQRFATPEDCIAGLETEAFHAWEEQDQLLQSWLQSTLSSSI